MLVIGSNRSGRTPSLTSLRRNHDCLATLHICLALTATDAIMLVVTKNRTLSGGDGDGQEAKRVAAGPSSLKKKVQDFNRMTGKLHVRRRQRPNQPRAAL